MSLASPGYTQVYHLSKRLVCTHLLWNSNYGACKQPIRGSLVCLHDTHANSLPHIWLSPWCGGGGIDTASALVREWMGRKTSKQNSAGGGTINQIMYKQVKKKKMIIIWIWHNSKWIPDKNIVMAWSQTTWLYGGEKILHRKMTWGQSRCKHHVWPSTGQLTQAIQPLVKVIIMKDKPALGAIHQWISNEDTAAQKAKGQAFTT